jgi:MFS family permease
MDFTNTISKLLTGTPQSQYAAIAILIAVIAIILSILFNENELTLGERLMLIGSVILFSIPSIILGLFDLTCVAGKTVENSLCWWWGWVIAFIIIIICVIVVFASVSSMLTYNVATSKSIKPVVDEEESNKIAKELVKDVPETVKPKVEMPSMSDMTMQQNIQGDMSGNVEGMGGYGGMSGNVEGMFLGAEPFRNKGKKEKFNAKKEKFSNYSIEGFEGCEYQGV